jgi:phage-related protein
MWGPWRAVTGLFMDLRGDHGEVSPAAVPEIVEDRRGNTYRAVYTVRFATAVFVLHVFHKKAKSGIVTPKLDMELHCCS